MFAEIGEIVETCQISAGHPAGPPAGRENVGSMTFSRNCNYTDFPFVLAFPAFAKKLEILRFGQFSAPTSPTISFWDGKCWLEDFFYELQIY